MVLAVVINITLSAIVFAAITTLVMRTIRSQDSAVRAVRHARAVRSLSREQHASRLTYVRPWA
jgi:hypothetical protein